jgi:hypothetical protein
MCTFFHPMISLWKGMAFRRHYHQYKNSAFSTKLSNFEICGSVFPVRFVPGMAGKADYYREHW